MLALLLAPLLAGPAAAEQLIRIGIVPTADRVVLSCERKCAVDDAGGGVKVLAPRKRYSVEATEDGLRIGAVDAPAEVRLPAVEDGGAVVVNGKRYRGDVILRRNAHGAVTAMEETDIEGYLVGVLPREMDPSWPLEALKAQAVVARTFAYTQLGKYKSEGFDLTGDTRSQVYGGAGPELPSVRKAVQETKREVLGYNGDILSVYYHACCGGHTADASDVWPSGERSPKPLRGVRDKYCDKLPTEWRAYFPGDDILAAVERHRLIAGRLRAFKIGRKDLAGFVRDFVLKVGDETMRVAAADLRQWLGASELRSTRVAKVHATAKGVELVGRGSGHGVGLCQWGAKVQAERGRTYQTILAFYFPGSTLSEIEQ